MKTTLMSCLIDCCNRTAHLSQETYLSEAGRPLLSRQEVWCHPAPVVLLYLEIAQHLSHCQRIGYSSRCHMSRVFKAKSSKNAHPLTSTLTSSDHLCRREMPICTEVKLRATLSSFVAISSVKEASFLGFGSRDRLDRRLDFTWMARTTLQADS